MIYNDLILPHAYFNKVTNLDLQFFVSLIGYFCYLAKQFYILYFGKHKCKLF